MKSLIYTVVILMASSITLMAGPWPKQKGQGYFKFSQWGLVYDQHFTGTGLKDPNGTTGIFNTSIYGEYGFTDRLSGILYAPLFGRTYMNNQISATTGDVIVPGEAINGLGDIDISLKYALNRPGSSVPIAATVLFGLPIGESQGGSQGNLQLGDGEFNQMLRLDIGTSWQLNNSLQLYGAAYSGVNNRTNGFSDEFRFGAELGIGVGQKLWVINRLNAVESFKNGDLLSLNNTGIFANNTEFMNYGVELAYNLNEKWGISVGFDTTLRGEITAAGTSFNIGVFTNVR